jgi:hypothetical protein
MWNHPNTLVQKQYIIHINKESRKNSNNNRTLKCKKHTHRNRSSTTTANYYSEAQKKKFWLTGLSNSDLQNFYNRLSKKIMNVKQQNWYRSFVVIKWGVDKFYQKPIWHCKLHMIWISYILNSVSRYISLISKFPILFHLWTIKPHFRFICSFGIHLHSYL